MSKLTQDMPVKVNEHWGNLEIKPYKDSNYEPLMPVLQQEFPNWNSKKIKSYMNLANGKDKGLAGVLAAKNTSGYYVGFLIYTFQTMDSKSFNYPNHRGSDKSFKVFVIENINACIPMLQKNIFLALVDEAINLAENYDCDYLELPTLATAHYELVKKKYKEQIQDPKDFRTYLKLSKTLTAHMEL